MITRRCDICKKAIKDKDVCITLHLSGSNIHAHHETCQTCIKLIPKLLSKILKKDKDKNKSKR